MMEKEMASETLNTTSVFTRLIIWEDFIVYIHRESIKSCEGEVAPVLI
jgi:hypothetical protein